jgi:hypothetical protein
MRKTRTIAITFGAAVLAGAQLMAAAVAAEKGSERGVIAIIKPGEKGIGDQGLKPGKTGVLPYIEKRKTGKGLTRMSQPPEPDKGLLGGPDTMPAWVREAFGNTAGGGGGGGGR